MKGLNLVSSDSPHIVWLMFDNFESKKIGSVWVLWGKVFIILTTRFCNLNNDNKYTSPAAPPHTSKHYVR